MKTLRNVIFIVCTLALARWTVALPDSVPKPVLAGVMAICALALTVLFATSRRKRPQQQAPQ